MSYCPAWTGPPPCRGYRPGSPPGAGPMRTQLLVIAKAPVPGQVTTRLCPPCTPRQAAGIAAAARADALAAGWATDPVTHTTVHYGRYGPPRGWHRAEDGGWWALVLRNPADVVAPRTVPMSTVDSTTLTAAALRDRGLRARTVPSPPPSAATFPWRPRDDPGAGPVLDAPAPRRRRTPDPGNLVDPAAARPHRPALPVGRGGRARPGRPRARRRPARARPLDG